MTKDGSPEDHEKRGGKQKKDAVPLTGAAKRANKAEDELKEQTKRLADMGASRCAHAQFPRHVCANCTRVRTACTCVCIPWNELQRSRADLLHMGRAEITSDADAALEKMQADKDKRHGKSKHDEPELTAAQKAAANEDPGLILTFLQWVLQKEKKPPLPWTISRREEVDSYLVTRSFGPYAALTLVLGESYWYNRIKHPKMAYMVCEYSCERHSSLLVVSTSERKPS